MKNETKIAKLNKEIQRLEGSIVGRNRRMAELGSVRNKAKILYTMGQENKTCEDEINFKKSEITRIEAHIEADTKNSNESMIAKLQVIIVDKDETIAELRATIEDMETKAKADVETKTDAKVIDEPKAGNKIARKTTKKTTKLEAKLKTKLEAKKNEAETSETEISLADFDIKTLYKIMDKEHSSIKILAKKNVSKKQRRTAKKNIRKCIGKIVSMLLELNYKSLQYAEVLIEDINKNGKKHVNKVNHLVEEHGVKWKCDDKILVYKILELIEEVKTTKEIR